MPESEGASTLDRRILELEDARPPDGQGLAALYNQRGCLRHRAGAYQPALEDFGAALRLAEDFAEAYNNRGCTWAELGEIQRARIDLARALALRPGLGDARENVHLLALTDEPVAPAQQARSTIATVEAGAGGFLDGLVRFLEQGVRARPGFEDCRDDAIAEIVARVLAHSQCKDLSLAEALREVRRTSTRGWARTLMGRFGRRGGGDGGLDAVPAREATPAGDGPPLPLRLGGRLEGVVELLLAASRPSKRLRRRIVWGVYVGGLLDGVHLSRPEVAAACRKLGLSARKATVRQIERDLDLLRRELRARGPEG